MFSRCSFKLCCNSKILQSKLFNDIWIQPAAGDAGGALGADLCFILQRLG